MLVRAFEMYPPNVDILIAMHRLDGDQAWRDLVLQTLDVTSRRIDQSIQDLRDEAKRFGQQDSSSLSFQLNQYAWLISNTEEDYQKALNYSLESLEIESDRR